MKLINELRFIKQSMMNFGYYWKLLNDPKFTNDRYIGEIIRNTHSIEKGLSLEHIRSGFGYAKIKDAFCIINKYKGNNGDMQAEPLIMFVDALKAYLEYHKKINFSNDSIVHITELYDTLVKYINTEDSSYGGTIHIERRNFTVEEQKVLSRLFTNRHSMREFSKEPVNETDLKMAIELAMRCPSACNRQCYRLHIVEKNSFSLLDNWFDGTGGFADDLDKLLFITGKVSLYRIGELYQWIVTGSVFASYLSLALEAYNIGCCFIQRPVIPDKKWTKIAGLIGASADEQLVCCLGIGKLKDSYNVPVSYRLSFDSIVNSI